MTKLRNFLMLFTVQLDFDRSELAIRANQSLNN